MAGKWVNYKCLRESVDFRQVLKDYGVELKAKRDQHQGFCPLPSHQGKKASPSFSANLKKGIWQCFGCGAKGNVIEFAARMEALDPANKAEFRKAALLLQERYGDTKVPPRKPNDDDAGSSPKDEIPAQEDHPRVVNSPLSFELKRLDSQHPYLRQRKLDSETIEYFGIGYCTQGLMKGRIAIPLHDAEGRLIGYAGRLVDDERIDEDNPKYKLPGPREHEGVVHDFSKSLFLFNGFRMPGPVDDLFLVEGFFGVFWLHQAGYRNVVALMGASCSNQQAQLLINLLCPEGRLWIMTDGDEAGHRCAQNVLVAISPHRFVRWAKLEDGKQPEDCSFELLAVLLNPPHK